MPLPFIVTKPDILSDILPLVEKATLPAVTNAGGSGNCAWPVALCRAKRIKCGTE